MFFDKSVNYLFESYIAAANTCLINIGYHKSINGFGKSICYWACLVLKIT